VQKTYRQFEARVFPEEKTEHELRWRWNKPTRRDRASVGTIGHGGTTPGASTIVPFG